MAGLVDGIRFEHLINVHNMQASWLRLLVLRSQFVTGVIDSELTL